MAHRLSAPIAHFAIPESSSDWGARSGPSDIATVTTCHRSHDYRGRERGRRVVIYQIIARIIPAKTSRGLKAISFLRNSRAHSYLVGIDRDVILGIDQE